MAAVRDALRRAAAATLVALFLLSLHPGAARAASSTFDMADQGVISVVGGAGSWLTIHGWDRPNAQLETDDEAVRVERRAIAFGTPRNPLSAAIPAAGIVVRDPVTRTVTAASLPPEEFPYGSDFRPGRHDVVRIAVAAGAHATLNVPANVALLNVRVRGDGSVTVLDYHGGTLFVALQNGRALLDAVTSAAFVQMMNGNLDVVDSSFDRIRARGNAVAMQFEHDRARQVEVTTVSGPILWDDGAFDPGLARFESTYGSIGIGVAGSARIAARSNDGRVYQMWDRRTPVVQRGDGELYATVGGGGPLVNVLAGRGNVYLYDGTLDSRHTIPPEWQQLRGGAPKAAALPPYSRFRPLRRRRF